MTGPSRLRAMGAVMMFSVLLIAAGGVAAPRFVDLPGEAPAFEGMMMVGAVGALVMMLLAPSLARRLSAGPLGPEGGALLAMAMAEGIAMLGIVSGSLARQPGWVVLIAVIAVLAIVRVQASVPT